MAESEAYYDDGRLSWPEAESLVDQFLADAEQSTTATTTEVLRHFDEEVSNHNIRRVHDALDERCVVLSKTGNRTRFELPDGGYIPVGGE